MSAASPPDLPTILSVAATATGMWRSRTLGVAVRLGIPELLESGPRHVRDLAAAAGAVEDNLYRLLRALAREGFFEEPSLRTFALTPASRVLLPGTPGSIRNMVLWLSSPWVHAIWDRLEDAVRSDASVFHGLFGKGLYDHLKAHPEDGAVFHGAMTEIARLTSDVIARSFDFSPFGTVVDVGGGTGEQIAAILVHHPGVRGVNFDAAELASQARDTVARHGVADRCEVLSGDLREGVPPGGDAYLIKNVIHDLGDERAVQVLSRCREALRPGGAVIVVQALVPELAGAYHAFIDLQQLLSGEGGKERTRAEMEALFSAAGLRISEIVKTPLPDSLIVGVA